MNLSVTVADYLTELVGDEDLALEVYDQLDPMFAPFAILAYRDQANGGETHLEPEIRKEVDRLTEILAEISREQDPEGIEILAELANAEDLVERLERLRDSLERALETAEPADEIDHYEDYRLSTGYPWNGEDSEDSGYTYGEDDESAHPEYEHLQEDILRAARKNGGYVLATREVWAKPVAKTEDGRWIFETEYGLEYLDFEDYEFSPEFIDFEQFADEEALTDLD